MATNPMQRRARNSFLLGMLITALIFGAALAGVIYMMMNLQNKQKELQASTVYIINKDVSSGEEIDVTDLTSVQVANNVTPANKVTPAQFQDTNDDGTMADKKVVSKINLKRGTVVTTDMLYIDATSTGDDVRIQEYNTIILPTDLENGEYVDIRLMLPSGQDFIVVSKKKVEIPNIGGVDSTDTIKMEMSEDEILTMSNATVEAYMINGSKLYATKYTDAGNQEAATPTYPINAEVLELLRNDQNILNDAKNALAARYSAGLRNDYINSAISSQDDAIGNEQAKMQESITNSQSAREEYLQSLGGAVTE